MVIAGKDDSDTATLPGRHFAASYVLNLKITQYPHPPSSNWLSTLAFLARVASRALHTSIFKYVFLKQCAVNYLRCKYVWVTHWQSASLNLRRRSNVPLGMDGWPPQALLLSICRRATSQLRIACNLNAKWFLTTRFIAVLACRSFSALLHAYNKHGSRFQSDLPTAWRADRQAIKGRWMPADETKARHTTGKP